MNALKKIRVLRRLYRALGAFLVMTLMFVARVGYLTCEAQALHLTADFGKPCQAVWRASRAPAAEQVHATVGHRCGVDFFWSLGQRKPLRHATMRDFMWMNGIGPNRARELYRWRRVRSWSDLAFRANLRRSELEALRRFFSLRGGP